MQGLGLVSAQQRHACNTTRDGTAEIVKYQRTNLPGWYGSMVHRYGRQGNQSGVRAEGYGEQTVFVCKCLVPSFL